MPFIKGIDVMRREGMNFEKYKTEGLTFEDFVQAGLPMVVHCAACQMPMVTPSSSVFVDEEGQVYCRHCVGENPYDSEDAAGVPVAKQLGRAIRQFGGEALGVRRQIDYRRGNPCFGVELSYNAENVFQQWKYREIFQGGSTCLKLRSSA